MSTRQERKISSCIFGEDRFAIYFSIIFCSYLIYSTVCLYIVDRVYDYRNERTNEGRKDSFTIEVTISNVTNFLQSKAKQTEKRKHYKVLSILPQGSYHY